MKILIIGIGNPGRGDDGLGPALAAGLAGADAETLTEGAVIEIPGRPVFAVWKYQLNIEDAALVRDYDAVVFADASGKSGEPVAFGEIAPAAAIAFTTHELSPQAVLALCEELYGRSPRGHLLAVRGYSWELGEGLSPEARRNLAAAAERLAAFLDSIPRP
jgi:hydrogenase maturation protease